ncbi:MAG: hypothetical protein LBH06_04300 [Rikenellaceae bacterium]|nr:hypothetical protein [Rikenellaceae bacterium]
MGKSGRGKMRLEMAGEWNMFAGLRRISLHPKLFLPFSYKNHKNRPTDTAAFAYLDITFVQFEPVSDRGKACRLYPIRNAVGVVRSSESHKNKKGITGTTS